MSAFTETPATIGLVAAAFATERGDAAPTAETLARQNLRSVAFRYAETQGMDEDGAAEMAGHLNSDLYIEACRVEALGAFMKGDIFKPEAIREAASSIEYQSCQTPDYQGTAARAIVAAVLKKVA